MRSLGFLLISSLAILADRPRSFAAEIQVWYGDEQRFGHWGNPHPRINILGAVAGAEEVESLTYSLNGGPARPLSMGPNGFRLSLPGAFNYWAWQGGETGILAREEKKRVLERGRRYIIRARVETLPGPKTRYSVKGWPAGEREPAPWDLVAIDGGQDVQSGSFLLVAHHSDVTFGDVEIRPLK